MGYLDKNKQDELNKIKRERKIGNLDSPKNPFDYYDREYGTVPLDDDRAHWQIVGAREIEVPLIVGRTAENRAGAIAHQNEIRDINR